MHEDGITDNSDDNGHHHYHENRDIPPAEKSFLMQDQQPISEEEEEPEQTTTAKAETEDEMVVARGNAAKVARGIHETEADMGEYTRSTSSNDHMNEYYADGEVCYTSSNTSTTSADPNDITSTTATTEAVMMMGNEKKNETCSTLNDSVTHATTTTCTTAATTTTGVVDDEDDYVVGNYGEEEDRAYKTSGAATLSQSEHIVQQQQQQQHEQGVNALISNVGLFLDQTWNWIRYFLVTIIFLNLVHFANRRESVVGEDTSVDGEVEGGNINGEENSKQVDQEDISSSLESEKSGNIIALNNCITSVIDEDISALLENSSISEEKIIMSPNTCSIQNQEEVENAEEAIMAVGVGSEEKVEAAPAVSIIQSETKPEEEVVEEKQQIKIILPSAEQVVVVSGEDASTSDSNTSEDNNGLAGIRRDSVDSYTSSEGSGNLGDIEAEICDKSSEDGTSSSSGLGDDENTAKQVAQKIISQVESMFSDEHLSKDGFLLKHVRRRSDGFVSLKLVAGLRKVKQISREFPVVLDALKDSTKLEINSEGTKVRRVEPLTPFLKSVPIKSKDKENTGKGAKDGSSNDENQLPTAAMSPSKSGNKENSNNENGRQGGGNNAQNRRNSNANNGNQSRRNSNAQGGKPQHRKSSNTSTTSSNNSSRHNSFSKAPGVPPSSQQHPADLFRNVYMAAYSSSGEECQSPQQGRRRGGSLPIAALHRASHTNGAYLSPNSSPPNGTLIIGPNGARPKSNSYCEGASPTTMSPWLQRRKASASSRLSNGELSFSGVIRQPKGPDGTKGFATGYRAMILEERLQQQQNSAVSA